MRPHGLQPTRLLCPWDFPGKNAGAGCHFLLQGIFPTQGLNLHFLQLLHWQADTLSLSHQGSRIANIIFTESKDCQPLPKKGGFNPWVGKIPWSRKWHPTPVLLPGKSHGWRSLVGCSPWGRQESGTTERLHFHFSLSCIGEGNGNPLQCSCLENPGTGEPGGLPSVGLHGVGHN